MREKFIYVCAQIIGQIDRLISKPELLISKDLRYENGITIYTDNCPLKLLLGKEFIEVFISNSHPFISGYTSKNLKKRIKFWINIVNYISEMPDNAFTDIKIMRKYVCLSELKLQTDE